MKICGWFLAAVLSILPVITSAQNSFHYQLDFPLEEFKARWEKLFDKIGENALAIIQGAPNVQRSEVFRQSNQFYYLCGVETPNAYIVLDGRNRKVTLYLPHRERKTRCGPLYAEDSELVKKLTGVDAVYGSNLMAKHWKWTLYWEATPPVLYTPFSPAEGYLQSRDMRNEYMAEIASDPWDGRPSREGQFIQLLRTRFPQFEIRNLSPILDELRNLKSPREIALIRRASQIACLGIMEAMRSTEPGVMEYQLDAVASCVFRIYGTQWDAYAPITAGETSCSRGHNTPNNSRLLNGELVLMDYAPEYHYYASDVTRMWPVNGYYTPEQRELCNFVLALHDSILKKTHPGLTTIQIMDEVREEMKELINKTRWSKPIYKKAALQSIQWYGHFAPHFSHAVGMAVHDVGNYEARPLEPGVVFALDPGIRVPEENLNIRMENTIVVTENGAENLSALLPSKPDEIEKLIREKGILQKFSLSPPWKR